MTASRVITLLSDFGVADAYVGIMKGVILGICPEAHLVDLSHHILPQDIVAGALVLRSAEPYFPIGTVHLAVVDPGVGSGRAGLVVETDRGWLVGPDNGLLSLIGVRRRTWRISNDALLCHPVSRTFHGRDIFAPIAARLAMGLDATVVGPCHDAMFELELPHCRRSETRLEGEVLYADRFGNLVTNIDAGALAGFPAAGLSISVAGMSVIGPVSSYTAVAAGEVLAIVGSWGSLEIAVRDGNAAQQLSLGKGAPVVVWVRQ